MLDIYTEIKKSLYLNCYTRFGSRSFTNRASFFEFGLGRWEGEGLAWLGGTFHREPQRSEPRAPTVSVDGHATGQHYK